jgi:hypothetical protein
MLFVVLYKMHCIEVVAPILILLRSFVVCIVHVYFFLSEVIVFIVCVRVCTRACECVCAGGLMRKCPREMGTAKEGGAPNY